MVDLGGLERARVGPICRSLTSRFPDYVSCLPLVPSVGRKCFARGAVRRHTPCTTFHHVRQMLGASHKLKASFEGILTRVPGSPRSIFVHLFLFSFISLFPPLFAIPAHMYTCVHRTHSSSCGFSYLSVLPGMKGGCRLPSSDSGLARFLFLSGFLGTKDRHKSSSSMPCGGNLGVAWG
jgi:hypothetical protein